MRKIILGLVAATAIAAPVAMATSANAATTDAAGVVTVAKGEVMAQFPGMNESAFQTGPKVLTGSSAQTFTTETTWDCIGGETQHHFWRSTRTTPVNFAPIINGANGKTTGWTMTTGASVWTENNTGGSRFPSYACPTGYIDFGSLHTWTPTVSPLTATTTFNGTPVSIVVNPYVAPVV